MSYLQPWMLWALPAVLLPILIHLLNRLRYRTVQWAAMLFLLKANRAATRRAKIRQYLLLASRCLVLLFLIWAMARPLALWPVPPLRSISWRSSQPARRR